MKYYVLLVAVLSAASAQKYTTPTPILKQINRHNEDGSYSYGYEAADGTYKIESKYPNGEVFGKYGYIDDGGKLREIEYGASRRGFEPQGNEVNVAPPTLNDNYPPKPLGPNEEDDGQYREDPAIYYKDEKYNNRPPSNQPVSRFSFDSRVQQPRYQQPSYQQPAYQQPQPEFRPTSKFNFDDFISNRQPQQFPQEQQSYQQPTYQQPTYQQPTYQQPSYQQPSYQQPSSFPQPTYQPSYQQPSYYNPPPQPYSQNYGHNWGAAPAQNVDWHRGSYTVDYKR